MRLNNPGRNVDIGGNTRSNAWFYPILRLTLSYLERYCFKILPFN